MRVDNRTIYFEIHSHILGLISACIRRIFIEECCCWKSEERTEGARDGVARCGQKNANGLNTTSDGMHLLDYTDLIDWK